MCTECTLNLKHDGAKHFLLGKYQKMGCIESKNALIDVGKRLDKLEAHMNLLDDDIYYIEKRLKRRGWKKSRSAREPLINIEDDYMSDKSNNSNDTTPPETVVTGSPKTKSSLYAGRLDM